MQEDRSAKQFDCEMGASETLAMKHYDIHGRLYDSPQNVRFYSHFCDRMIERLETGSFEKILEVGCGTGILTQKLAHAFPDAKIHALDVSENMLHIARAKKSLAGTHFFRTLDELPRENYDLIVSNYSYHWWSSSFCGRLGSLSSRGCLFALSAPARCKDLSGGNIAIARAIRNIVGHRSVPQVKTAGISEADVNQEFGFANIRTFDESYEEEFGGVEDLLENLKIRGSILALSQAYGVSEKAFVDGVQNYYKQRQNTAIHPRVIKVRWPSLIIIGQR